MSKGVTKSIIVDAKELGFKSANLIEDLARFLTETLPRIQVTLNGNNLEIEMPTSLSIRAIKLRIKKFLHKKSISNDFRPISIISSDKVGYLVKEKKKLELSYY